MEIPTCNKDTRVPLSATLILLAAWLPAAGQSVQVYETYADQSRLLAKRNPGISFASGSPTSAPSYTITVNGTITYQTMDGVGASLTDSAGWVIWNKLTATQRDGLMQSLVDPALGIGISLLRQPMGASDFSASGDYSYDDVPSGQSDPNLNQFSISHDQAYLIPLVLRARSMNPSLKVLALPWSPPAWMKTNSSMNGGNVLTDVFPSLAQYFVRFIQAYQQQGIPIYAISMQNEPLNSNSGHPTAYVGSSDEANFIGNYLGPALAGAGLGGVKIFGYEHNWDNTQYPKALLANAAASGYLAGTAFHCYGGDVSAQSQVKQAYPAKDIWFTECSGTAGSGFAGDLAWNAENLLIGATRNWARSVILWNIALDQHSGPQNGGCTACRGVVTVDWSASPPNITRNVEYYVLGHLGKFLKPGAVRIDSNTFGSGSLEDVAFANPDGSVVLLVLNAASAASTFAVSWNGSSFTDTLPAGAVATYVFAVPANVGVFRASGGMGVWYLDNGNNSFDAGDKFRYFGLAGDQAVAGDWTGNGQTRLGVFRNGMWYLDLNNNGQWDGVAGGDGIFAFGLPGDVAVVGDWNGDGRTKLGVFRCPPPGGGACTWVLDMAGKFAYDPATAKVFSYGLPGDTPVVNNWNDASNVDQIGVYRPMPNGLGLWIVDSNGSGGWEASDAMYWYGLAQDMPVVGNWNSGTRKRIGVFRNGVWILDTNGNNAYDATDGVGSFGLPGDQPVVGNWSVQ